MSTQHVNRDHPPVESHLDQELTQSAGTDSLEPVQPARDIDAESGRPRVAQTTIPASTKRSEPDRSAHEEAKTRNVDEATASTMLETVMRVYLIRPSRFKVSTFIPSSRRMYTILHSMNQVIMNNFYARRSMPALHPLPVRIYFGILFYIQTLRCMYAVNRIDSDQADFINRFLSVYPPEDLHIPGPLLLLFKAISTSQPEDTSFGKVSPAFPDFIGPENKDALHTSAGMSSFLPQVPILMAMNFNLANLDPGVNSVSQWSPIKPGSSDLPADVTFMGHTFARNRSSWSDHSAWALSTPGVEYPIEANAQLMDSYRQNAFTLSIPDANDDIQTTEHFLGLNDLEWFGQLNEMMTIYAKFFRGSGTLSDCSLSGVSSNQIFGKYLNQRTPPAKPTGFGDPKSLVKLEAQHFTTDRKSVV